MRFAALCAGLVTTGCGFATKPYANDPLLRGSRAVWFAREPLPQPVPTAPRAVEPPPPPISRWE
ncbi:hypothetical protein C1280_07280 [Gemmata obscuriglobus]|uniref:Uncharacterized protein n=1 Tax=Gemmata obscuriglobus TaxID=114 RepID=A0A2Z3GU93_9BACT|nr:hypothetical protein C1280_07280 [Gemmata obscuriglobus]